MIRQRSGPCHDQLCESNVARIETVGKDILAGGDAVNGRSVPLDLIKHSP